MKFPSEYQFEAERFIVDRLRKKFAREGVSPTPQQMKEALIAIVEEANREFNPVVVELDPDQPGALRVSMRVEMAEQLESLPRFNEDAQAMILRSIYGGTAIEHQLSDLGYYRPRLLPTGEWAALQQMLYTTGLFVMFKDDPLAGWRTRYCYEKGADAREALAVWSGEGDPPGPWVKQYPEDRLNPILFNKEKA